MKKRTPDDQTPPQTARGPRLQWRTLRVLTDDELGAVNGAVRPTNTWTTAWWCNTFDTANGC